MFNVMLGIDRQCQAGFDSAVASLGVLVIAIAAEDGVDMLPPSGIGWFLDATPAP